MNKRIRNFFTLTRKANDGFTLVELIVVIAILAILGGVAIPAYSGYVKKANKGADQQLISEVQHALELYAYSNFGEVGYLAVVLNQEGTAPAVQGDETQRAQAQEALAAAFGAPETLGLKYADWNGVNSTLSYKDSSYYGQESSLIQTVDKLTGALGDVVEKDKNMSNTLIGGEFETFLKDNEVNTDDGKAVGNATVLYVANKTQGNEEAIKNAFAAGLSKPGNPVNNVYAELYNTGIGEAASLAAIYAYAEGYAQATGQADAFHANTDFSAVTNASDALNALGVSFGSLNVDDFDTYKGAQGNKDLQGYIDMMGTVHDNSDIVSGNLNSSDCFTDGTVENILKGHAAMSGMNIETQKGQVAVVLIVGADGSVMTYVAPPNWNK